MTDAVTNFAKATVSTGYTSTDSSIVLVPGHGAKFPSASSSNNNTWFNVVWYNSTDYPDPADDPNAEIVRVINNSADTLTLLNSAGNRVAQEGTSATNKNIAGKTYLMILAATRKTILDLSIVEPSIFSFTVAHPSASRDNGVAFTLGTFMKYGNIKKITLRGSYTMGTLYPFSALASSPTTGITPAAGSFLFWNKTGSIFVGDYIGLDNEIMRVSGTTAVYITAVRGVKGTSKTYHNHDAVITKMVNGVRIELFTDNTKKVATKRFLELNNMLTYSGITSGSINAGGTVIRMTAAPRNLDKTDYILIQDSSSETAMVQSAFGSVVGTTHDNTIFVFGSLALHKSAKNIQKLITFDAPTPYKGSSNTLYGNLYVDERVPAGGTIVFTLGITVDKFGSIALG